jgi:hypothetical protein
MTLRRVTSDPSYRLMGTWQAVGEAAEPPTASGRGAVTKPCGNAAASAFRLLQKCLLRPTANP